MKPKGIHPNLPNRLVRIWGAIAGVGLLLFPLFISVGSFPDPLALVRLFSFGMLLIALPGVYLVPAIGNRVMNRVLDRRLHSLPIAPVAEAGSGSRVLWKSKQIVKMKPRLNRINVLFWILCAAYYGFYLSSPGGEIVHRIFGDSPLIFVLWAFGLAIVSFPAILWGRRLVRRQFRQHISPVGKGCLVGVRFFPREYSWTDGWLTLDCDDLGVLRNEEDGLIFEGEVSEIHINRQDIALIEVRQSDRAPVLVLREGSIPGVAAFLLDAFLPMPGLRANRERNRALLEQIAASSSLPAPRQGGGLRGCLASLAIFGGVTIGALCALHVLFHLQFVAARDTLYRMGVPASLEELDAGYPQVPPEANAAELYRQAREAYSSDPDLEAGLPVVNEHIALPELEAPIPEDMRSAIQRYLDANASAIDLLHRAAAMPQCRFPIDLRMGYAVELPHLVPLRDAARMLGLRALLAADGNDAETAAQSLLDALAIGHSLREEPLLISGLVRIAWDGVVFSFLEQVSSRTKLSNAQLAQLGEAISQSKKSRNAAKYYIGEGCVFLAEYDRLFRDAAASVSNEDMVLGAVFQWGATITGYCDYDKTRACTYFASILDACAQPYPDRIDTEKAAIAVLENSFALFASKYCPKLAVRADVRGMATLRVMETALAIQRYCRDNNTPPGQLSEMVPKYFESFPEDPFDGAPLRYTCLPNGFLIYSIGPNRIDDGGNKPDPEKGESINTDGDIVFQVEGGRAEGK